MSTIIWIVILIVALAAGIGAGYFIGFFTVRIGVEKWKINKEIE